MMRLQIHHMSTPAGEGIDLGCPHCGKKFSLVGKLLDDGDTVLLDYDGQNLCKGDRVKVWRIDAESAEVREHISCFLGWEGVVTAEPSFFWTPWDRRECWVEFGHPCPRHGDTGGIFLAAELEKLKPPSGT